MAAALEVAGHPEFDDARDLGGMGQYAGLRAGVYEAGVVLVEVETSQNTQTFRD